MMKNNKITLMIVDDEPFIRRTLSLVLQQNGFQVQVAEDGQEAWEKLKGGIIPKIIFIDVMMPRLSGFELCKMIKANDLFKNIHVILLTARWQKSDRIKAESIGIDEYITKPFSPSNIIRRVQNIIKVEKE